MAPLALWKASRLVRGKRLVEGLVSAPGQEESQTANKKLKTRITRIFTNLREETNETRRQNNFEMGKWGVTVGILTSDFSRRRFELSRVHAVGLTLSRRDL